MYIHEAVKSAMEKGLAITRQAPGSVMWSKIAIVPTNTNDCCFIVCTDIDVAREHKIAIARRWNPLAEDLLANDWVLVPRARK